MLDAQIPAGLAEAEGFVATTVVAHDARDGDAKALRTGDGRLEEGNGAVGRVIGLDLGEGDAAVIVNADMDELPADTAAIALASAVAGDTMANMLETPRFSMSM